MSPVDPSSSSPLFDQIHVADPGDSTLNKFRYQHAYGVILALGSIRGKSVNFGSIYCEHHEDLLAVDPDNKLHAYQVKTLESGEWHNNDEAFYKSIRRFVELHRRFGDQVVRFHFVSNQRPCMVGRDTKKDTEKAKSPQLLLEMCADTQPKDFPPFLVQLLKKLCALCSCKEEELLSVLRRTTFVRGPALDSFEDELISRHLHETLQDEEVKMKVLKRMCREMIDVFTVASGLPSDPDARIIAASETKAGTTTVSAKQVSVSQVQDILDRRMKKASLVGLSTDATVASLEKSDSGHKLVAKLERGGLYAQVTSMQRRKLNMSAHFLEWAHQDAREADEALQHLQGVVDQIYADEHARIASVNKTFGLLLYNSMGDEFKRFLIGNQKSIYNVDCDILWGIAAYRTGECLMWWSEPFEIGDAS